MKLSQDELFLVKGGAFSAAFISAVVRAFTTIMDFGRKIGSSIRRGISKNYCKL